MSYHLVPRRKSEGGGGVGPGESVEDGVGCGRSG